MSEDRGDTWTGLLRPIVERLELCAKMGLHFSESPDGCAALAELIKGMAGKLDGEIERQRMVMMGPGFGASIGNMIVALLWLAAAGWVIAIVLGLWLLFR